MGNLKYSIFNRGEGGYYKCVGHSMCRFQSIKYDIPTKDTLVEIIHSLTHTLTHTHTHIPG